MIDNKKSPARSLILIILTLAMALSACNRQPEASAVPQPTASPAEPQPTYTPTAAPARLVLYDPSNLVDPSLPGLLTEMASTNALGFETWTALGPNLDGVRIMLVYGDLPNLADVAASAPQTQFVVLSHNVTSAANISVMRVNEVHQAFVAGYLAVMLADEFRATALISDNTNLGLADAFENGGRYLCGSCTSVYTPLISSPNPYTLSGSSDAAAWAALTSAMLTDTNANTVFIGPDAELPEVLDLLPNAFLIGSDPASLHRDRFIAIFGPDILAALQQTLPDLLAGNGGKDITAPVKVVVNNNPELISPAKLQLLNQVIQDLQADKIVPLSIP